MTRSRNSRRGKHYKADWQYGGPLYKKWAHKRYRCRVRSVMRKLGQVYGTEVCKSQQFINIAGFARQVRNRIFERD